MNIGALYQTKEYFWSIFPSKDIASDAPGPALALRQQIDAKYYTS